MKPDNSIEPIEPVKPALFDGISRVGDLEIELDTKFQQREWRWERAGWALITFVVVASLLGLFSTGPLSKTMTGTPSGGIQVKYDRFARRMAPIMMEVVLEEKASQRGKASIQFSRTYIEKFELVRITPEPSRTEAGKDWVVYTFDVADPPEPTGVTFYLRSEVSGVLSGNVRLEESVAFPLRQFVYP